MAMDRKQKRKYRSVMSWIFEILALAIALLSVKETACAQTLMVSHEWSPSAGKKQVTYAASERSITMSLSTDGFQETYLLKGGSSYVTWVVSFQDGRHEYLLQCRSPYQQPGTYTMKDMNSQIKIKTGQGGNVVTWISASCDHEVVGNELVWHVTLPVSNPAFQDDFDLEHIKITSYNIQEFQDENAPDTRITWSMDEEGMVTIRDGEVGHSLVELSQKKDQVKSIDLDVSSLVVYQELFSDYENLETATIKAESLVGNNLSGMFRNCYKLREVKLSDLSMTGVIHANRMFENCQSLEMIVAPRDLTLDCELPAIAGDWFIQGTDEKVTALPKNAAGETILVSRKEEVSEILRLDSVAACLDGTIGLRFFVSIPKGLWDDENYVCMELHGRTKLQKFSEAVPWTQDGETLYGFTVPVYVKEIYDKVLMRVYDKNGMPLPVKTSSGKDITETGLSFSVAEYMEAISNADGMSSELKRLAYVSLQYGIAAKMLFNYQAEDYSLDPELLEVTAEQLEGCGLVEEGDAIDDIIERQITLEIVSDTVMYLYLGFADDETMRKYEFYIDGGKEPVQPSKDQNLWKFAIPGIAAKELDDMHQLTIKERNGEKSQTLRFSALTYVKAAMALNGDDVQIVNIRNCSKLIFLYNQAAAAYFEQTAKK
jgi:hypothetical protein